MRWEWQSELDCVGVDEAGRGCLAGPVFAGAVLWRRPEAPLPLADECIIRDSKTLSRRQRDHARAVIEAHADAWAVGSASVQEIDERNILGATMLAMHRAIDGVMSQLADGSGGDGGDVALLVDGERFSPYVSQVTGDFVPHTCVPQGDAQLVAVAAASILAKTHKDEFMSGAEAHGRFPCYGWDRNAGYGTAGHMRALREHGPCELHRRSFAPVRRALLM